MDKDAGKAGHLSPASGSPSVDIDPTEFAEYLRAERERRRLSIDQIADETKIASRHLAALERGDVRNWPGGMYRRAMMRAYAESIGVDREYALQQFERAFEPKPAATPLPEPAAPPPRAIASRRPVRAVVIAALGLVVAAVITASWRWYGSAEAGAAPPVAAPPVAAPPVAAAPVAEPPAPPATSEGSTATSGSTPAAAQAPVAPAATEGNLLVSSSPAGARVTVNGIGWGETPITIRNLEFGTKRVRVTMAGYISAERAVSLGPEQPNVRVNLSLRARE